MELMKVIFIIAITMALTITLSLKSIGEVEEKPPFPHTDTSYTYPKEIFIKEKKILFPSKRLSRFLAEDSEDDAAHNCNKEDNEICYVNKAGRNSTCCNKKCTNTHTDKHNCGACKKKCKYTESCCRGQCVDLAYDKRHCGRCNHRCGRGEYCVYALCNYA
ncbi:stigma-specific STIG1-like protein 1 [Corylus avellana]|uniref:stigma-specific STIG1-like protein 1 n=1 Tax=Corylus avellana TaxID=13451 RepID=UPI001E22BD07|nr:stigma-specific STIG1-like protein 1 [Corylus avellana]XP_059440947.1 stigma-specific STIG1-like protein 1 [Corylus avellana]